MTGNDDDRRSQLRPPRRRSQRSSVSEDNLADLLLPALRRLGFGTRARQVQIELAWPAVVGEAVAREARPSLYERGRLIVETSSPPLSHQLHLQRQLIIDGLNQAIGAVAVHDIHFRLAPSAPPTSRDAARASARPGRQDSKA